MMIYNSIKMKPIQLDKIKEKEKLYNTVNYLVRGLKSIMMNIINYEMLKK